MRSNDPNGIIELGNIGPNTEMEVIHHVANKLQPQLGTKRNTESIS